MTTPKPRYEPQIGSIVEDKFDDAQLELLRSIKNDDNFINSIRNIVDIYICFCQDEAEKLNSGEIKATLKDLRADSATLSKKLENLPDAVYVMLWKLNYKHGSPKKLDQLKSLLGALVDELDDVLDNLPLRKPGRNLATANRYAAELMIQCFESFGITIAPNQWQAPEMSPATKCLDMIFHSGGKVLSRSGVEAYLKPDQEKK